MTIRLYHSHPETLSFTSTVVSCKKNGDNWDVELESTAFFPEGGGQMCDLGTLDGIPVLHVHEKDDRVFHTMPVCFPLQSMVEGQVDPIHRHDMMQQHTGEHILSGIICSTYHASNVGFHIGPTEVRLDFNVPLSREQLAEAEHRANEAIWRDLPVKAWFPGKQELETIDYRSKKELNGDIRIVRIPEYDTCACCGTHCLSTGQVGQIKILDAINYKGGVRLTIACGRRALKWHHDLLEQNKQISQLLSAKPLETAAAVTRAVQERDQLRQKVEALSLQAFRSEADALAGQTNRLLFSQVLETGLLRKAAGLLAEGAEQAALFLPREEGWNYALSSVSRDMRPLGKVLNAAFNGKGGGPRDMVQGMLLHGTRQEIEAFLAAQLEKDEAQ